VLFRAQCYILSSFFSRLEPYSSILVSLNRPSDFANVEKHLSPDDFNCYRDESTRIVHLAFTRADRCCLYEIDALHDKDCQFQESIGLSCEEFFLSRQWLLIDPLDNPQSRRISTIYYSKKTTDARFILNQYEWASAITSFDDGSEGRLDQRRRYSINIDDYDDARAVL